MLEQERLIQRVRAKSAGDPRLEAALMYGSFTQALADQWSDIEFWLFFDDDTLPEVDPAAWCRDIAPTLLVIKNEFGTHVAIFETLIRGEFHFVPRSQLNGVAQWPARGAPVERMLVVDRSGALRRVLDQVPERAATSPQNIEQVCGRFVNWLVLGDAVLRRGEVARAHAVLAEVNRYLLWMVRLIERTTERLTPSRLAEAELSREALDRYVRATAPLDPVALRSAYRESWDWGREMWTALAVVAAFQVPAELFRAVDARMRAA